MSSNTNLGNTPVSQGYTQLFHTGETGGLTSTLQQVFDGDGTGSDLYLATNKVKIGTAGNFLVGSKTIQEYIQDIVGDMLVTNGSHTNLTATYDDNGDGAIDLNAQGAVTGITAGTGITTSGSGNITINVNTSSIATRSYVDTEVAGLVDSAPGTLDTLNELASALGDDPNFATTTATNIGTKLAKASNLSDLTNAGTARTNLGVDPAGTDNSTNVTLAGSLDYLTLSGQQITRNAIDLTTDVTGTLPVGNGGTGLTSISTLLNSNVTPTSLGLVIGTNVQAYDPELNDIASIDTSTLSGSDNDKFIAWSFSSASFVLSSFPGTQMAGSTNNGLLTYNSQSVASVESNLTFDGTDLRLTGDDQNLIIGAESDLKLLAHGSAGDVRIEANNKNLLLTRSGVDRFRIASGGLVINEPGNNLNFRVEGNTDQNLLKVEGNLDRVGIGVGSPGSKLHVQNGATSYSWTPYAGTTALFEGTSSNHSIVSIVGTTTGQSSVWFGDTDHQSIGRIRYENSTNNMEFWTNNTEKMSINAGGNIGIGVTDPSTKLEVAGHTRISGVGNALYFDTTGQEASNRIRTINDYETLIQNARGSAGFAVIGNSNIRLGFGQNFTTAETDLFINNNGAITFNNAYTFPTSDGSNAQVLATNGSGNLFFTNALADPYGNLSEFANVSAVPGDDGKTIAFSQSSASWILGPVPITTSGTTQNGLLTYNSATTMAVESNLTFSGGVLSIDNDDVNEGGQINLLPGTGHTSTYTIDNFYGHLRFFSSTTAGEQFRLTSTGNLAQLTGTKHYFNGDGGNTYIDEVASGQLRLVAGGTEAIKFYSSGAVDMYGGSTTSRSINIGANRSGNGYSWIDLVGDATYTNYGARFIRGNGGPNTSTEITHRGTGVLALKAYDAGSVRFYTSNTERVRVDSSGNVSIGDFTPGYKLDVAGDINLSGYLRKNGLAMMSIDSSYTTILKPSGAVGIYLGQSDASNYYDNTRHRFRPSGGGTNYYANLGATGLSLSRLADADAKLHIGEGSNSNNAMGTNTLGTTAGDKIDYIKLECDSTNANQLIFSSERVADGSSWTTTRERIRRRVDTSEMGYIEFGSSFNDASDMISFGRVGTGKFMGIGGGTLGRVTIGPGQSDVFGMLTIAKDAHEEHLTLKTNYASTNTPRGAIKWRDAVNVVGAIHTEFDGTDVSMRFGSLYNSGYNTNTLMTLTGQGQLGIGVTSPAYKLDVVGTSRTDALIIDGGGTYAEGSIYSDSNWGMLFRAKQASPTLAEFRWANSADSELMRIDSSGHVGINETNPLTELHLGTCPDARAITFDQSGRFNGIGNYFSSNASDSQLWFYCSDGGTNGDTNIRMKLFADGRLKLTNSNNVDMLLAKATQMGYSSSYKALVIGETSGTFTTCIGYDPSTNASPSFTGDGREVIFRNGVEFTTPNSANNGFHNDVMVLKDGNVGIAVASPGYKLDVNGNGRFVADLRCEGRYLSQDGSMSAPSYSFNSQGNAGMFRIGTGVGLSAGGSTIVQVNADGRVNYNSLTGVDHITIRSNGHTNSSSSGTFYIKFCTIVVDNSPSNYNGVSLSGTLYRGDNASGNTIDWSVWFNSALDSAQITHGGYMMSKGAVFIDNIFVQRTAGDGEIDNGSCTYELYYDLSQAWTNNIYNVATEVHYPSEGKYNVTWNSDQSEVTTLPGTQVVNVQTATFDGTNQTKVPHGSASYPSYSFLGDMNTGIYRQASDTMSFSMGGTEKFRFESDGDFHTAQDVIAYSTTPSDRKLKDNIKDIEYGLDTIMQLSPKEYDWKKDNRHDIGFIAQEVEEVIPEIVKNKEWFDDKIKTLDYEKLTAVLIKAVQEQQEQINKLEEKLNG